MNSKQRVNSILKFEKPDRPAIGFFAIDSDTAARVLGRETYWRAKGKSQIAFWEGRRDEVVESWKKDSVELYKKLDILDIIPTWQWAAGACPEKGFKPQDPPRKVSEDTWEDKQGKVYKYSPLTEEISVVHDPTVWSKPFVKEDLLWDGAIQKPDESVSEVVDVLLKEFGAEKFVLGPGAGHSAGVAAWYLHGNMERGFMEIAMRPQDIKEVYTSQCRKAIAHDKYWFRKGMDGVFLGTDLSSNKGPMISPACYRELFLDGYKARIKNLKDNGYKVIHHFCGNNWALLDIFVELGIDCYQSIQASAGMDIVEIHKKYGNKFAVWGGVQVEHLVSGTADDVRKDVNRVMTAFAGQSGFILGTSHSVAVGTKYENFMAMMDEFAMFI